MYCSTLKEISLKHHILGGKGHSPILSREGIPGWLVITERGRDQMQV